ncbi:hypothetical protein NM962_03380 [Mycobacterium sp. SVM_VP21]|nr:hypothetical protein NM962_03380 [Mycobacterium sp. SVM_VP21]
MVLLLASVAALAYWLGTHRRADEDNLAGWRPWLLVAGTVLGVILLASLLTGGPGPLWGPGPIFGP